MANVEFDFGDELQADLFPAHGWAETSQGLRILWLPLVRRLETHLQLLDTRARLSSIQTSYVFRHYIINLVTVLAELHRLSRVVSDNGIKIKDLDAESIDASLHASAFVPIFFECAVSYLRRIPDLLAHASRAVLFERWHEVPMDFKDWTANVDKLETYSPRCNFPILRQTILDHTKWFDDLRGKSKETGLMGLRDAYQHRPVRGMFSVTQAGDLSPKASMMLDSRSHDVESHRDVLYRVPEATRGLCGLMTVILSAIEPRGNYERGDFVFALTSRLTADSVKYWPQIERSILPKAR